MLHALRDRTAANAVLIARICRGVACDLSSAAPSQSAWHHNGLRSLQLAARACFEHGTPSASAAATSPAQAPAVGAGARRHAHPLLPAAVSTSSRMIPSPSRAGMPLNDTLFQRIFRTSSAHGAAAAAAAEPAGAAAAPVDDSAAAPASLVLQRASSGVPLPPWTPTDQRQKRKTLPKRMGFMLQVGKALNHGTALHSPVCRASRLSAALKPPSLPRTALCVELTCFPCALQELEKERMEQEGTAKKLPDFRPGDSLELKLVSVPVIL